jgi:O-antigen ligase
MIYAGCALILLSRASPLDQQRLIYAMLMAGVLVLGLALLLSQTGPGRSLVMRDYRLRAGFENSNQLGLMVVAIWPLALALLLNARTTGRRMLFLASVLILAGATLLSGTKTALALSFVSGSLLWLYHASRSGSLDKTLVTVVLVLCGIVLAAPLVLWLVSHVSPVAYERITAILSHGVWAYSSMQSRDAIWQESIRIALAHPLLGSGAGTKVLGFAHSHNLSLDYFRGMGVFALAAIITLVGCVLTRAAGFIITTWGKGLAGRPMDVLVAAMYLGSIFYLVGNHLSDSLSPTTAYLFWLLYLGAYLSSSRSVLPSEDVRGLSTRGWSPKIRGSHRAATKAASDD